MKRQSRAKRNNVFGLQVSITLGELSTQKSLRRVTNCITSHTGIMGITTFPAGEGITVCISSQTQAAIVGIPNHNRLPKTLITFLEDPCRIWIADDGWKSPCRKLMKEEFIVEVSSLDSKADTTTTLRNETDILCSLKWKNVRKPEEREMVWRDF